MNSLKKKMEKKQNTKSTKGLFEAVSKRVVMPSWIWAYLELKASFYHMPVNAFVLMIVQKEMEKTSAGIQRYMETEFFNKVNGIEKNIDPFDSDVADILKASYNYSVEMENQLNNEKESFYRHNVAAGWLELKFADYHYKKALRLGYFNKLAREGWVYDARLQIWRTKSMRSVKSKDIGLAEKMVDILNTKHKPKQK